MKTSVLINNYNYGKYLDECLTSLLNQTKVPDEIILYDDGSTDNSIEIVSKYPSVKLISNKNFGQKPGFNQGNAINVAFNNSSGDIIFLLDSDDFFHQDKIKMVVEEFNKSQDIVMVQNASFEFSNGVTRRIIDNSQTNLTKELYYQKKWTGYYNSTSSLAFSRKYLNLILPLKIDTYWRVWPDVRLSRLAPFFGKVVSIPIPLTYYRRHDNNDSSAMNLNFTKSLQNQIDHHEYINSRLKDLGYQEIKYKKSLKYLSFKLKTILPKKLVLLIQKINK